MMNIESEKEFDDALRNHEKVVVHFWAGWCEPCTHLDTVLEELVKTAPQVACLRVEAEEMPEVSERCSVAVVPLFVFFSGGKEVDRLEGADAASLTEKFLKLSGPLAAKSNGQSSELKLNSFNDGLKSLINKDPVMLFMKGTPSNPCCGFSAKVVDALQAAGCADFGYFDILTDEEVRQGLKEYSNWPTYPQLYINGEFLGGCDIVMEMAQTGELKSELAKVKGVPDEVGNLSLNQRIEKLISAKPIMLFMKGTPDAPQCGFSRRVSEALSAVTEDYGHFDILKDEEVRQGLKEYSNWPTYPQLYVNGELIGGCDIIMEMAENGELKQAIDDILLS